MDVIINADRETNPSNSKPLKTQGSPFLNYLMIAGYPLQALPLGSLLAHFHRLSGQWLIANPIHWQATHNDATILATGDALGLSDSDARVWFDEVAACLLELGLNMYYHDATTWLVQVDTMPPCISPAPHQIMHHSLMPFLSTMDNTGAWPRILTELQMLLSSHRYHQQHSQACPVNGVWFSGGGVFDINKTQPVMTDSPELLQGCAWMSAFSPQIWQALPHNKREKTVLWMNNPETLAPLQKNFHSHTVQWYWHNTAYCQPKKSWFSRFMNFR